MSRADRTLTEQRELDWVFCSFACLVALTAELCFAALGLVYLKDSIIPRLQIGHALLIAMTIGVLVHNRFAAVPARAALILSLVILVPLPILFWLSGDAFVNAHAPFDPCLGHRVVMIAIAIFFPAKPRATVLVISAFALLAVTHFLIWTRSTVSPYQFGEPWLTGFYWIVSCVLVLFRAEVAHVRGRFERSRNATAALRALARASRALCDGTYTSLQTIDLTAHALREQHPEFGEAAGRLERASARLRDVVRALREGDLSEWEEEDYSFQAEQRIAEMYRVLRHEARSSPADEAEASEAAPETRPQA